MSIALSNYIYCAALQHKSYIKKSRKLGWKIRLTKETRQYTGRNKSINRKYRINIPKEQIEEKSDENYKVIPKRKQQFTDGSTRLPKTMI